MPVSQTPATAMALPAWLDALRWDEKGLIPVIAQEAHSKDVLMFAWMNRESLQETVKRGRAVYFSRSRNKLWAKGEESGQVQTVHEIRIDCDNDVLLLQVSQPGSPPPSDGKATSSAIACHTGRHSCFFSVLKDGQWQAVDPVLQDPHTLYK